MPSPTPTLAPSPLEEPTPVVAGSTPLEIGVEEAVDKEKIALELDQGVQPLDSAEPDNYDRFSRKEKRAILTIVSYAAFLGRTYCYYLS
jgi:hypothetical protein